MIYVCNHTTNQNRPEDEDYEREFVSQYKREYGFVIEGRPIIVDDIRVRVIACGSKVKPHFIAQQKGSPTPINHASCYFEVMTSQVHLLNTV
jgi:5-oxoprolinase (ATP-hydrolysing)